MVISFASPCVKCEKIAPSMTHVSKPAPMTATRGTSTSNAERSSMQPVRYMNQSGYPKV